jgi:hypothetical protein
MKTNKRKNEEKELIPTDYRDIAYNQIFRSVNSLNCSITNRLKINKNKRFIIVYERS